MPDQTPVPKARSSQERIRSFAKKIRDRGKIWGVAIWTLIVTLAGVILTLIVFSYQLYRDRNPVQEPRFELVQDVLRSKDALILIPANPQARKSVPLVFYIDGRPSGEIEPGKLKDELSWALSLRTIEPALAEGHYKLRVGLRGKDPFHPIDPIPFDIVEQLESGAVLERSVDGTMHVRGATSSPGELNEVEVVATFLLPGQTQEIELEVTKEVRSLGDRVESVFYFDLLPFNDLPEYGPEDPEYTEIFFRLESRDLAGNRVLMQYSYSHFITPGVLAMSGSKFSEVLVEPVDSAPEFTRRVTITLDPDQVTTLPDGSPALKLVAKQVREGVELEWTGPLEPPAFTRVVRNGEAIAAAFGPTYLDREAEGEHSYRVEQPIGGTWLTSPEVRASASEETTGPEGAEEPEPGKPVVDVFVDIAAFDDPAVPPDVARFRINVGNETQGDLPPEADPGVIAVDLELAFAVEQGDAEPQSIKDWQCQRQDHVPSTIRCTRALSLTGAEATAITLEVRRLDRPTVIEVKAYCPECWEEDPRDNRDSELVMPAEPPSERTPLQDDSERTPLQDDIEGRAPDESPSTKAEANKLTQLPEDVMAALREELGDQPLTFTFKEQSYSLPLAALAQNPGSMYCYESESRVNRAPFPSCEPVLLGGRRVDLPPPGLSACISFLIAVREAACALVDEDGCNDIAFGVKMGSMPLFSRCRRDSRYRRGWEK